MIPEEVVNVVCDVLEVHEIPYMISGSFASNTWGKPRATNDADILIQANIHSLNSFLSELQKDFFVDITMAADALKNRSMFNIIHHATGFKIDFIIPKERPFSLEEFRRRTVGDLLGRQRWFSSPEDTILVKLEWSGMGSSEKQFLDAAYVFELQEKSLDIAYVKKWASQLGVTLLLEKLVRSVENEK